MQGFRLRGEKVEPVPTLEKPWQDDVLKLAAYGGWELRYHTFDSRRSTAGFPDLVLVRVPEILYVELKTDKGRLTKEQRAWLDALGACGQECYVWRPRDLEEVVERLKRRFT